MKNTNPARKKRKTNWLQNDRATSIREIPAKRFCPQYFDELEADKHVKRYIVIKDLWYMDSISYVIKAIII